jgi:DNA-cytosine methyltransferase
MRHGSLFSGIEGFGLGFERAGFKLQWQVEHEPFCNKVLATHWPAVQRFADVRTVGAHNLSCVDCITAGVPYQDVSVAGKRAGLAGERTGLFYEFARILRELRPAWFVFENVPGLFSSNHGRDFAEIQRVLMVECGYGICWRVLDSRYFGVAQRRRRVFIVGRFGKPCPPEILFEPKGGSGNSAPGGKAWARVAGSLTKGVGNVGNEAKGNIAACIQQRIGKSGFTDPVNDNIIAAPITSSRGHHGHSSERGDGRDNLVATTLSSGSHDASHAPGRRREDDFNIVATLNSSGNDGGFRTEPGEHIVIQDVRGGTRDRIDSGQGIGIREGGPCYTLGAVEQHAVAFALRQDPGGIGQGHNTTFAITENTCNRSQGPANYVSTPPNPDRMRDFAGLPKGMDSSRYRSLGNAVTVQVAYWIAQRILAHEVNKY